MIAFVLGILTWLPVLIGLGGVGVAGVAIPMLGLVKGAGGMLARLVGYAAIALTLFASGYRVADEQAELERLRGQVAWMKAEIEIQQEVGGFASSERSRLQNEKVTRDKLLADAIGELVKSPPAERDACRITDAHLRARDRLRLKARAR